MTERTPGTVALMGHVLDQADVWVDKEGQRHLVEEMSVRYKSNVVGYLERRARAVASQYAVHAVHALPDPDWVGEAAFDSLMHEVNATWDALLGDPLVWLRGTTLVQRLRDDVAAGRGGVDGDEQLRNPASQVPEHPGGDLSDHVPNYSPED